MTETVGKRMQQARKEAGLTQEQLAEQLGVHKQSISDWERGVRTPYLDSSVAIASALDVTLDWLAAGKPTTSDDGRLEPLETAETLLRLAKEKMRPGRRSTRYVEDALSKIRDFLTQGGD